MPKLTASCRVSSGFTGINPAIWGFGPWDAVYFGLMTPERVWVKGRTAVAERRRWPRLPLAIPVFVRSQEDGDKEFLEFATALNVSAGGMLLAVRRSIAPSSQLSLEIPSAPLAALSSLPKVARNLRARVLRTLHGEGYNLVALRFSRPLTNSHLPSKPRRRKLSSSV